MNESVSLASRQSFIAQRRAKLARVEEDERSMASPPAASGNSIAKSGSASKATSSNPVEEIESPSATIKTTTTAPTTAAPSANSETNVLNKLAETGGDSAVRLSNAHLFSPVDEYMMKVAFEEGRLALGRGEVPVGVVYAKVCFFFRL